MTAFVTLNLLRGIIYGFVKEITRLYTIWSSIQQTLFLISLTGKYMHEMSILVAKKATCTSKNLHALVHVFTRVNRGLV